MHGHFTWAERLAFVWKSANKQPTRLCTPLPRGCSLAFMRALVASLLYVEWSLVGLEVHLVGVSSVLFPGVSDSLSPVEGCLTDLPAELLPYCESLGSMARSWNCFWAQVDFYHESQWSFPQWHSDGASLAQPFTEFWEGPPKFSYSHALFYISNFIVQELNTMGFRPHKTWNCPCFWASYKQFFALFFLSGKNR